MDTTAKNKDTTTSTEKKLDDLYHLIEGIKTCMMTTRRSDGSLVSRAMAPRKPDNKIPTDLWFATNNESHKLEELNYDPHVNLAFFKESTSEWISVAGKAHIVNDRAIIQEMYSQDLKAWIGDQGDGVHDGGPNDPRISLVFVEAESVHYSLKDRLAPVQLFNVAKGMVTGEPPKLSAERDISKDEIAQARNV